MLPHDNKSIPQVYGTSSNDGIYDAAVERCMSRLMNAFASQSLKEATAAFKDLMSLIDLDD
jgi:hypothetical protein